MAAVAAVCWRKLSPRNANSLLRDDIINPALLLENMLVRRPTAAGVPRIEVLRMVEPRINQASQRLPCVDVGRNLKRRRFQNRCCLSMSVQGAVYGRRRIANALQMRQQRLGC